MPKDERPVSPLSRAEQIALFRGMTAKTRQKLPPFIQAVEREEDNCTFFITFTEVLSRPKCDRLVDTVMAEHRNYVSHAQWTTTGKLLVRLRKPRRDIEPDSRRAARCDIAIIASQIFVQCR